MTTNHAERLDPALKRFGRVDMELYIGPCTRNQFRRMFLRFYPDAGKELVDRFVRNAETFSGLTPAQLRGTSSAAARSRPRRPPRSSCATSTRRRCSTKEIAFLYAMYEMEHIQTLLRYRASNDGMIDAYGALFGDRISPAPWPQPPEPRLRASEEEEAAVNAEARASEEEEAAVNAEARRQRRKRRRCWP